jgi:hypothetical protein
MRHCGHGPEHHIIPTSFRIEDHMSDILAPLTIDFLTWLAAESRDYIDVMDAWRTSCPRLTVWEDAIDAGLINRVHVSGQPLRIELTERGQALLAAASTPPTPNR